MAILENVGVRTGRTPFAGLSSNQQSERPQAKLWLNIGYHAEDKFINLPLGLPIDTMDPAPIRGQNEEFVQLRSAQNELLKALQDLGVKMAPGEEKDLVLTVQLRRVNEQMTVASKDNKYSVPDLASKLVAMPVEELPVAAE